MTLLNILADAAQHPGTVKNLFRCWQLTPALPLLNARLQKEPDVSPRTSVLSR